MARPPAPVKGVYQREDDPSGNWYARFRIDGKLVKKSFGMNRTAAIEYVEKARTLRRTGEGHVPSPPRGTQDRTRNGDNCRNVVGAPLRALRVPLAPSLGSTDTASDRPVLFAGFAATVEGSDF